MIEITAKQLYEMYDFMEENKNLTDSCGFQIESGEYIMFKKENGEWKPTTDLIIKA